MKGSRKGGMEGGKVGVGRDRMKLREVGGKKEWWDRWK